MVSKENLKALFKAKAEKAQRLANEWNAALNEWLRAAESVNDIGKMESLCKNELLKRKEANKAMDEMRNAWQTLLNS